MTFKFKWKPAPKGCTLVLLHCYFALAAQPIPGPHPGEGNPAVAERWLTVTFDLEDEKEAAAAPAMRTASARILIESFIFSYPLQAILLTSKGSLPGTKDTSADRVASPSNSVSSIRDY